MRPVGDFPCSRPRAFAFFENNTQKNRRIGDFEDEKILGLLLTVGILLSLSFLGASANDTAPAPAENTATVPANVAANGAVRLTGGYPLS